MKLQASRPISPKNLQSQTSALTKNRLALSRLGILHGRLEKAYAQARGGKRGELLFAALLMCWERPLPEWVFSALAKLLVARQPKISDAGPTKTVGNSSSRLMENTKQINKSR
jgi:hypothetical protein